LETTSGTDPVSGLLTELAQVSAAGEAANGLVRVKVDGTGAITDLVIEPKAMRLASEDLADAVREAFGQARADVQQQLTSSPPSQVRSASEVDDDLRLTLDEIGSGAQRTLAELTATVDALSRRLDQLP
jgi:DNA-binding protein YbaB